MQLNLMFVSLSLWIMIRFPLRISKQLTDDMRTTALDSQCNSLLTMPLKLSFAITLSDLTCWARRDYLSLITYTINMHKTFPQTGRPLKKRKQQTNKNFIWIIQRCKDVFILWFVFCDVPVIQILLHSEIRIYSSHFWIKQPGRH